MCSRKVSVCTARCLCCPSFLYVVYLWQCQEPWVSPALAAGDWLLPCSLPWGEERRTGRGCSGRWELTAASLKGNTARAGCEGAVYFTTAHRNDSSACWGFAISVFLMRLIPPYFLSCTEIRGRVLHVFLVPFLCHQSWGHARCSFSSSPVSAPVSTPADHGLQSYGVLVAFLEVPVSNHPDLFPEAKVQHRLQCQGTSEGAADTRCRGKKMLL